MRGAPDRCSRTQRPGRRERGLPGARRRGTSATTSTPRARCCSAASRARAARRVPAAHAGVYTTPFDAADPVNTPRGLNTATRRSQPALADAVNDLQLASIPLDAPLRDCQYEQRGDEKIPIHGGPGDLGVFNAINVAWVPAKGYPDVPHGSSFVMAAQLRPARLPGRAHDPHLLAVDQPDVAVLRRPDADVLAQGVGNRTGFCEPTSLADRA